MHVAGSLSVILSQRKPEFRTFRQLYLGLAKHGIVFPSQNTHRDNKNSTECVVTVTRWPLHLLGVACGGSILFELSMPTANKHT